MADSFSSSSSVWEYDVFLSFRGIDTRKTFVGFLHKELERRNIKTFKDDKELETGSSISRELIQAIEGSRFAIVVVSENYASSSWCLEELAKIMECEEKKSLTAIPIFYEVDPSHVRWQKGKFAEHFKKHEKREKAEKVQRWRGALTKLANKSGMDSRNWEDNADLIDEITKDILNRLNSVASSDFTGLVGMDVHMEAIYSLLGLESNNEVRMIGIWGMGGVGKTTLAKYIYEKILRRFQTHCFLEDVKKIYHNRGPSGLREELVSSIQREDQRNSYLGSNVINQRLGRRKVLLVVDDVDDVRQLNALAKEKGWFGPGSRVIVTTRDKHLLNSCEIKHVYEAKCLADDEALQLFCQFAFKQKFPLDGFQSLSKRAVRTAGGLPLALEVFGAFLCDRDKGFWEDAFHELETSLDVEKVTKVLKISYEGLREGDKSIFLYVACFFDGKARLSDMVGVFDKGVKSGIELLSEKCLIRISVSGDITMHDLVKQMGRELMCQQSPHDPGKRRILCKPDEIKKVLRNKRESETVEAISLDIDKGDQLIIGEKTFENVPNLRSLRIRSSSFDGETKLQYPQGIRINCPDQLTYLSWLNCPSKSLQIYANNLVKLDLRGSNIAKLWENPPCFESLKEIDVSKSKNLKEFPDLSKALNLEVIRAEECSSLTEIPPSICSLDKLTRLNLWGCEGLQHIPNNMDMKSLEDVCLWYCSSLKMYPESCRGVKYLFLNWERKGELPESISRLSYLEHLELNYCETMKHLPDTFGDLLSLKYLRLHDWPMLQSISESICHLSYLESLGISFCPRLKHLPDTIGDLISLKSLLLWGCPMLSIPQSIGRLSYLECLELLDCERLEHLPDTIGDLISLKLLRVKDCHMLKSIPKTIWKLKYLGAFEFINGPVVTNEGVGYVISRATEESCISESERLNNRKRVNEWLYRKRLFLQDCPRLERLTSQICGTRNCFGEHDAEETSSRTFLLPNIEELIISRAEKSDGLSFPCPSFSNFPSLWKLYLINLNMLEVSGDIDLLTGLKQLDLSGNDFGTIPASIRQLTKLSKLKIDDCVNLYSLPELPPNIEVLSANGCIALAKVSEVLKFDFSNKMFSFCDCFKFEEEIQLVCEHMVSMVGNEALIVLPVREIPSCIDHRSEGSSLTVSLPRASSSVELMGFVACIVVEGCDKAVGYVQWTCQLSTSDLRGKVSLFREVREPSGGLSLFCKARVHSGNMLFLNGDLRLKEKKEVVFNQISFEFSFTSSPKEINNEPLPEIKECGVCLQFTPTSSSSSSLAAWDTRQGEVKEPSAEKHMKSFRVFRLFLFLFSFLLLILLLIWAENVIITSNKLPFP